MSQAVLQSLRVTLRQCHLYRKSLPLTRTIPAASLRRKVTLKTYPSLRSKPRSRTLQKTIQAASLSRKVMSKTYPSLQSKPRSRILQKTIQAASLSRKVMSKTYPSLRSKPQSRRKASSTLQVPQHLIHCIGSMCRAKRTRNGMIVREPTTAFLLYVR